MNDLPQHPLPQCGAGAPCAGCKNGIGISGVCRGQSTQAGESAPVAVRGPTDAAEQRAELEDRKSDLIDLQELRARLNYAPETGVFTWVKRSDRRPDFGSVAGGINKLGYRNLTINKILVLEHRLAWFYVHGVWPEVIDHINGCRSDNRLSNLRNVNHKINCLNRISAGSNSLTGVLGVQKRNGYYRARISFQEKLISIGNFKTVEEASMAYEQRKKELYKDSIIHSPNFTAIAESQGHFAKSIGKPTDSCPYVARTPEWFDWQRGYAEGVK